MTEMSVMSLMVVRFTAASILFLMFFKRLILPIPPDVIRKGFLLGLFLFLGFVAQTVGLKYTTASKSSFITSMMVVFAPFLQILVSRRSPTIGNILGILVVCIGLWLFTSPEGSSLNFGDFLTLLCALLFAIYIVYLDVVSTGIPVMQLSFLQVATCAVLSSAVLAFSEPLSLPSTGRTWFSLVYLTLLATVVTTFVQTRFQKETTPTRAAVIFTVEPLFASLFAFLLLDEVIGGAGIAGGAIIVLGILLSELSELIPGLKKPLLRT
jgi:drug/metabolite transporter (DMT)-like permease